jgi:hypothetical protein
VPDTYFAEIRNVLESLPDLVEALSSESSYLTCFTEISDSLVLWNMYTPDSNGIAIEFDSIRLGAFARNAHQLTRVCYHPETQVSMMQVHLKSWVKIVEDSYGCHGGLLSRIINDMMHDLVARIYCYLPAIKSPAYDHEREWRLISYVTDNRRPSFRCSATCVIPYVEVQIGDKLPVSGLIIGPNCDHPERIRLSLEMVMAKAGYDPVPIRTSTVPYTHSAKR